MKSIKLLLEKYKGLSVAAKAATAYLFANLFTKGLGVITTPIFTRIMTTAEIGEFNTFASWYTIISVVATLSLSSGSFSLAMFEFKDERDEYSSTMVGLSTASALIVAAIYFVNPMFWNNVLSLNTVEVSIMLLAFLLVPATEFRLVRLRYEYKYKTLIAITLINSVCGTFLAILAVLLARNNNLDNLAQYRIIGLYTVICLMGLINYIYIVRKGKTFFKKQYLKFVLINNTPLIANALAKHVLEVSDRTMITKMVGKSETGIYSILYTVSSLSIIVWSAIESSLLPYMFETLSNKKTDKLNSIINPLLLFFAGVCLTLTLVAPEIVKILATEEYYKSIYIMPPVACGVYFTALYHIFGDVLLFHKKTHYILFSTCAAAISNIVLNYFCIKRFGYFAAAYTTLFSYILLGIIQYISMRRVHPERIFDIKFIVIMSTILVILSIACMSIYDYIVIRYALVVVLFAVAFIFRKKIISNLKAIKRKR